MPRRLDVFFDYGSPFAYMLSKLLPEVAKRASLEPIWRPIDLSSLESFRGGLPYSQKKRAYLFVDVARAAEFHGIDLQVPKPFPVEAGRAHRLACAFAGQADFESLHAALFEAAWRESRDLAADAVLGSCLEAAGAKPEPWLAAAASADAERAVAENLEAAEAAGVFGVPAMLFEDELFWGVDALPVLEWRATSG